MTMIATIIMIYNKFKDKILFNLIYWNFVFSFDLLFRKLFKSFGENGKLPLILSVWFPNNLMLLSFRL